MAKTDDISIARRKDAWWVQLWFKDETWERGYHYKKDALAFANDIVRQRELYLDTFHPEMLHMYPLEGAQEKK